jgi:hypothetical protein
MKPLKYILPLVTVLYGHTFPIQEIEEMAELDTQVRTEWIDTRDISSVRKIEEQNTLRLQTILRIHGLPQDEDDSLESVISSIEQLVLRSSDLAFQKEYLKMAEEAGDEWGENLDLLTDRILLREGHCQRYGTHVHHVNGTLIPYPIEDLANVDVLRAGFDEPPLEESLKMLSILEQSIDMDEHTLENCLFNAQHDFFGPPANYLYYASFQGDQGHPTGPKLQAFDRAILAIFENTPEAFEALYDADTSTISLQIDELHEVVLLGQTPLYVYLVPKETFQRLPYFNTNTFVSHAMPTSVAKFELESYLDGLVSAGAKVKIFAPNLEYEISPLKIRDQVKNYFFFDITLENETQEV